MPDDPEFPTASDFLADARHDFPQFYAMATTADKMLMDAVVMMHAALVVGMNTPRAGLNAKGRVDHERACIDAEQEFSRMRAAVRACPTFQRVSDAERFAIETVAFRVPVPEA